MTRVIAGHVAALRKERRLSGAALSRRVRDLGVKSWTDSTISKLETGRRESVGVTELFALALALDVSPLLLLADPRTDAKVPVGREEFTEEAPGRDIELDAWTALLWMCGMARPDRKVSATTYGHRSELVLDGLRFAERVEMLMPLLGDGLNLPEMDDARDAWTRQLLESVAASLHHFERQGTPLPAVPTRIVRAALQLGIELPGVLDEQAIDAARFDRIVAEALARRAGPGEEPSQEPRDGEQP